MGYWKLYREEPECVELLESLRKKLEEGADNLQLLLEAADRSTNKTSQECETALTSQFNSLIKFSSFKKLGKQVKK